MQNQKLDFKPESLQEAHVSSVKAGDVLLLRKQADGNGGEQQAGTGCYTEAGELVGTVPAATANRLEGLGEVPASIRSVKKNEHGGVQELLLRVVIGKDGPVHVGKAAQASVAPTTKPEYVIDDDGFQLRHLQLQQLVHNQPVVSQLADDRLQALIRSIDSAPNREQALITALGKPAFKDFCDQVLDLLEVNK